MNLEIHNKNKKWSIESDTQNSIYTERDKNRRKKNNRWNKWIDDKRREIERYKSLDRH